MKLNQLRMAVLAASMGLAGVSMTAQASSTDFEVIEAPSVQEHIQKLTVELPEFAQQRPEVRNVEVTTHHDTAQSSPRSPGSGFTQLEAEQILLVDDAGMETPAGFILLLEQTSLATSWEVAEVLDQGDVKLLHLLSEDDQFEMKLPVKKKQYEQAGLSLDSIITTRVTPGDTVTTISFLHGSVLLSTVSGPTPGTDSEDLSESPAEDEPQVPKVKLG